MRGWGLTRPSPSSTNNQQSSRRAAHSVSMHMSRDLLELILIQSSGAGRNHLVLSRDPESRAKERKSPYQRQSSNYRLQLSPSRPQTKRSVKNTTAREPRQAKAYPTKTCRRLHLALHRTQIDSTAHAVASISSEPALAPPGASSLRALRGRLRGGRGTQGNGSAERLQLLFVAR